MSLSRKMGRLGPQFFFALTAAKIFLSDSQTVAARSFLAPAGEREDGAAGVVGSTGGTAAPNRGPREEHINKGTEARRRTSVSPTIGGGRDVVGNYGRPTTSPMGPSASSATAGAAATLSPRSFIWRATNKNECDEHHDPREEVDSAERQTSAEGRPGSSSAAGRRSGTSELWFLATPACSAQNPEVIRHVCAKLREKMHACINNGKNQNFSACADEVDAACTSDSRCSTKSSAACTSLDVYLWLEQSHVLPHIRSPNNHRPATSCEVLLARELCQAVEQAGAKINSDGTTSGGDQTEDHGAGSPLFQVKQLRSFEGSKEFYRTCASVFGGAVFLPQSLLHFAVFKLVNIGGPDNLGAALLYGVAVGALFTAKTYRECCRQQLVPGGPSSRRGAPGLISTAGSPSAPSTANAKATTSIYEDTLFCTRAFFGTHPDEDEGDRGGATRTFAAPPTASTDGGGPHSAAKILGSTEQVERDSNVDPILWETPCARRLARLEVRHKDWLKQLDDLAEELNRKCRITRPAASASTRGFNILSSSPDDLHFRHLEHQPAPGAGSSLLVEKNKTTQDLHDGAEATTTCLSKNSAHDLSNMLKPEHRSLSAASTELMSLCATPSSSITGGSSCGGAHKLHQFTSASNYAGDDEELFGGSCREDLASAPAGEPGETTVVQHEEQGEEEASGSCTTAALFEGCDPKLVATSRRARAPSNVVQPVQLVIASRTHVKSLLKELQDANSGWVVEPVCIPLPEEQGI
ncbi:unnamed protein product [Amoebophrya sp. A120]|nr:unnamed protein product [Amoebophrya sp. A120]|eukprot:GSA120T00012338001.1